MRLFVESRLFIIAEHNNSPVAFIWSTPDYNQIFQKMNRSLGLFHILLFLIKKQQINKKEYYILWVLKKKFRNQNIGSYLKYEILVEMKNRGYLGVEVSLMDEENA